MATHEAVVEIDDYSGHTWHLRVTGNLTRGYRSYHTQDGWVKGEPDYIEDITVTEVVSIVDTSICEDQGIELDITAHSDDVSRACKKFVSKDWVVAKIEEKFLEVLQHDAAGVTDGE